jgi:hypothetical protein
MTEVAHCEDCGLAVAALGEHGCKEGAGTCGAHGAECFDCLLECRTRALTLERTENEGLRSAIARLEHDKARAFKANERLNRDPKWRK